MNEIFHVVDCVGMRCWVPLEQEKIRKAQICEKYGGWESGGDWSVSLCIFVFRSGEDQTKGDHADIIFNNHLTHFLPYTSPV